MGFLWRLSKFGLRVGLVAGAVKITYDNDIWSLKTDKGAKLYEETKEHVVPGTIIYREKLPSLDEVETAVGNRWNHRVERLFNFVDNFPSSVNTVANRLINNK
ncbi:unnamed protein product, partial [Mesorhabditis belari]|uniref:MICOS complex subunit MIC13 n=1 Tax=Mesorhabditis belari TaxID=2138241 RepID=A0AAF3EDD5_9BILA